MIKRRKVEAMVAKQYRARGEINQSSEEEDESNTRDNMDLDQADDKYLLPLQL